MSQAQNFKQLKEGLYIHICITGTFRHILGNMFSWKGNEICPLEKLRKPLVFGKEKEIHKALPYCFCLLLGALAFIIFPPIFVVPAYWPVVLIQTSDFHLPFTMAAPGQMLNFTHLCIIPLQKFFLDYKAYNSSSSQYIFSVDYILLFRVFAMMPVGDWLFRLQLLHIPVLKHPPFLNKHGKSII